MSHKPAKFRGHKHCGSGYIIVLVHHVILQDQVTKVLSNFVAGQRSS